MNNQMNNKSDFARNMPTQSPVTLPRVLFAAPYSSGGKTTLAAGFMRLLRRRGVAVAGYKCGPDYVDAAWHKAALEGFTRNIDLFFCGGDAMVRGMLAEDAPGADIAVIEGVMGYYDGAASTTASSTWDMAQKLAAPAILIVYAKGITQTLSAIVRGIDQFRSPSGLAGVVLNCCRESLYGKIKDKITADTGLPVLGYLPVADGYEIPSRSLGLWMPGEVADAGARLDALAAQMEKTLDVEGILALARAAPPLAPGALPAAEKMGQNVPVALAKDEAFSFYYDENLQMLEKAGAKLLPFSPLRDAGLPAGAKGLYLGGGYVEAYAKALSQNQAMRASVAAFVRAGGATLAEGGGFLYLQQTLVDENGRAWPMAGALPGTAQKGDKRARFGYITATAKEDNLLCKVGQSVAAHEFHEWDSDAPGAAFACEKPVGGRAWAAGVATQTLYAGFPQFYLPSNPAFAQNFVAAAARAAV